MNKTSQILQYVSDLDTNTTLLSEAWQCDSVPGKFDSFSACVKDLAIAEGYSIDCYACPRPNGVRGGGVAVAILSPTNVSTKLFSVGRCYTSFESLFINVRYNQYNFLLGNIYRSPSTTVSFTCCLGQGF